MHYNWLAFLRETIDFTSYASIWYWIVLAAAWSAMTHRIMGVPWDMIRRANWQSAEGMRTAGDIAALVRIHVRRLKTIMDIAGPFAVGGAFFGLTVLAMLGFGYGFEFPQAAFLILFPIAVGRLMSVRLAYRLHALMEEGALPEGFELWRLLARHRLALQLLAALSILVTTFWGMAYILSHSVL